MVEIGLKALKSSQYFFVADSKPVLNENVDDQEDQQVVKDDAKIQVCMNFKVKVH